MKLLTRKEAAQYLSISITTLERWEKKGRIHRIPLHQPIRYALSDLKEHTMRRYTHDKGNPPTPSKRANWDQRRQTLKMILVDGMDYRSIAKEQGRTFQAVGEEWKKMENFSLKELRDYLGLTDAYKLPIDTR